MFRYLILVCAVLMQMCLGATYSWSVYVHRLKLLTDLGQGPVQLPFTLFYFTFPATMVIVGNFLDRLGPRKCAMTGGLIFGCGWIVAGLGVYHFGFTVLGIGFLAGIGVGAAYLVPITTAIQWFPNQKGLVTGIAVAGFGGGAALVSQIGERLMNQLQFSPFQSFMVLGVAFLILVTLSGTVMKYPTGKSVQKQLPLDSREIIGNRSFIFLYISMFTALAAGFTVNANLKELYPTSIMEAGVWAVSLFALANALGRITWGFISDRLHPVSAIRINLLGQAVLLLAGFWLLKSMSGFLIFATLAGFNYGGVLVIYASAVARHWGADRMGKVYGWLFSANIPAAVAPLLAGLAFDQLGGFTVPLVLIACLLILVAVFVRRQLKDLR